ncbi:MAG: exo-alpha-sialidase, partial [Defluviitaleaceae bacterium]|nr:exo-alpha-sialidase [Defluviitaleaceae bacterium]
MPYIDEVSNRRFADEYEGIGKILSHAEGEAPTCCNVPVSVFMHHKDFRGEMPVKHDACLKKSYIEWETPPVENENGCVFSFIMNTRVIPEYRPAFPYITARLTVADTVALNLPLSVPRWYSRENGGVRVEFNPKRFISMTEEPTRLFSPDGTSGVYSVYVPKELIKKDCPVKFKVEPEKNDEDVIITITLSPRRDILNLSLAVLRDELAQLQSDVTELKLAHAMLQAKAYPELFPNYLNAERGVAVVEETRHMHPPTLCKYDGDNLILTYRRGTEHLSPDGAAYAVRSFDKGQTFTKPEKLFDFGNHDHRSTPLLQISNGDLVGCDYRVGAGYDSDGVYKEAKVFPNPTLWGVWSSDRGRTWTFTDKPLTVPNCKFKYCEAERPLIELP